jgi:hypothetical protein
VKEKRQQDDDWDRHAKNQRRTPLPTMLPFWNDENAMRIDFPEISDGSTCADKPAPDKVPVPYRRLILSLNAEKG